MINEHIKPQHCEDSFCDLILHIINEKKRAKKEGNKTEEYAMKIAVNSVYGKLGFENSWLFDEQALTSVCINGQLYILMLVEMLGEAGFEILSANTDGVTSLVSKNRELEYQHICTAWEELTNFELEFKNYHHYIRRDINNYIIIDDKGEVEKEKGIFLTKMDIQKGYNMPIVAKALKAFFTKGIPIETTVSEHTDILDFCKAQKIDSAFTPLALEMKDGELIKSKLQKTNRYFVATSGVTVVKNKEVKRKPKSLTYVQRQHLERTPQTTMFSNYQPEETTKEVNIALVAKQKIQILNEYDNTKAFNDYKVKYQYYINEANKTINKILYKDLSIKKKAPAIKGIKTTKPTHNQLGLF